MRALVRAWLVVAIAVGVCVVPARVASGKDPLTLVAMGMPGGPYSALLNAVASSFNASHATTSVTMPVYTQSMPLSGDSFALPPRANVIQLCAASLTTALAASLVPLDAFWADADLSSLVPLYARLRSRDVVGMPVVVPFATAPVVCVYTRSFFASHGLAPPATYADLVALCERVGAVSSAACFGGLGGGRMDASVLFDHLFVRMHGNADYDAFTMGEVAFTDARVQSVFNALAELALLPFFGAVDSGAASPPPLLDLAAVGDGRAAVGCATTRLIAALIDSGALAGDDIGLFAFPEYGGTAGTAGPGKTDGTLGDAVSFGVAASERATASMAFLEHVVNVTAMTDVFTGVTGFVPALLPVAAVMTGDVERTGREVLALTAYSGRLSLVGGFGDADVQRAWGEVIEWVHLAGVRRDEHFDVASGPLATMLDELERLRQTRVLSVSLMPEFAPVPGTYVGSVALSLSTPGPDAATIVYTIDGSSPLSGAGQMYVDGEAVVLGPGTYTVKAVAQIAGLAPSAMVEGVYRVEEDGSDESLSVVVLVVIGMIAMLVLVSLLVASFLYSSRASSSVDPGSLLSLGTVSVAMVLPGDVVLGRHITGSPYASVFEGEWRGRRVLVSRWARSPDAFGHTGAGTDTVFSMLAADASLVAECTHPVLLPLVGVMYTPMAMVYEGDAKLTLHALLHASDYVLPAPFKAQVAADLATGMASLAAANVVHGALSTLAVFIGASWNIRIVVPSAMLSPNTPWRRAVTFDGASERLSVPFAAATMAEVVATAPEVVRSGSVAATVASDAYALGTVLWELATRRDAAALRHPLAVVAAIATGEYGLPGVGRSADAGAEALGAVVDGLTIREAGHRITVAAAASALALRGERWSGRLGAAVGAMDSGVLLRCQVLNVGIRLQADPQKTAAALSAFHERVAAVAFSLGGSTVGYGLDWYMFAFATGNEVVGAARRIAVLEQSVGPIGMAGAVGSVVPSVGRDGRVLVRGSAMADLRSLLVAVYGSADEFVTESVGAPERGDGGAASPGVWNTTMAHFGGFFVTVALGATVGRTFSGATVVIGSVVQLVLPGQYALDVLASGRNAPSGSSEPSPRPSVAKLTLGAPHEHRSGGRKVGARSTRSRSSGCGWSSATGIDDDESLAHSTEGGSGVALGRKSRAEAGGGVGVWQDLSRGQVASAGAAGAQREAILQRRRIHASGSSSVFSDLTELAHTGNASGSSSLGGKAMVSVSSGSVSGSTDDDASAGDGASSNSSNSSDSSSSSSSSSSSLTSSGGASGADSSSNVFSSTPLPRSPTSPQFPSTVPTHEVQRDVSTARKARAESRSGGRSGGGESRSGGRSGGGESRSGADGEWASARSGKSGKSRLVGSPSVLTVRSEAAPLPFFPYQSAGSLANWVVGRSVMARVVAEGVEVWKGVFGRIVEGECVERGRVVVEMLEGRFGSGEEMVAFAERAAVCCQWAREHHRLAVPVAICASPGGVGIMYEREPGVCLAEVLSGRAKARSASELRTIALNVGQAVADIHASPGGETGHSALHPGNVWLVMMGGRVQDVRLTGYAGGGGGRRTCGAAFLPSAAYVAPEEVGSVWNVDGVKADVFRFGLLLYQLVTQRQAQVVGDDVLDGIRSVAASTVSELDQAGIASPRLQSVVWACWCAEPAARPEMKDILHSLALCTAADFEADRSLANTTSGEQSPLGHLPSTVSSTGTLRRGSPRTLSSSPRRGLALSRSPRARQSGRDRVSP